MTFIMRGDCESTAVWWAGVRPSREALLTSLPPPLSSLSSVGTAVALPQTAFCHNRNVCVLPVHVGTKSHMGPLGT